MKNTRLFFLSLSAVVLMLPFLLASCGNNTSETKKGTDSIKKDTLAVSVRGEKLIKQIWDDFKNKDFADVEKFMGEGFQSDHDFGAYNADQELKLIKGLDINSYALSEMQFTKNGSVIIATYKVAVEETLDGKRLSKEPEPRMSIFNETAGEWKWIAHANLRLVPAPVK